MGVWHRQRDRRCAVRARLSHSDSPVPVEGKRKTISIMRLHNISNVDQTSKKTKSKNLPTEHSEMRVKAVWPMHGVVRVLERRAADRIYEEGQRARSRAQSSMLTESR